MLEKDKIQAKFQFTHPVWGATTVSKLLGHKDMFQFTHPVWGATAGDLYYPKYESFNSRTPCGVRHLAKGAQTMLGLFQFTHPVWGATTARRARS